MSYTDEEMIKMLTNKCPLQFCKVVEYITGQLALQTSNFVKRSGGKEHHVKEVLNYALFEAHKYALNNKFKENTNVLAFVFQITKHNFNAILRRENRLPTTSIEDVTGSFEDTLKDVKNDEEPHPKMKIVLNAIEQLTHSEYIFLMDVILSGMCMKELAKKYNLKNAQIARNKKSKILNKLRNLLDKKNNKDE